MAGRSLDRLGRDYSWDDFAAFVRFAPTTSRLSQAVNGPSWSRTEWLLAKIIDALWIGNWQRSRNRRAKRPTPIEVPGWSEKPKTYGAPNPLDRVRDFLNRLNGRSPETRP